MSADLDGLVPGQELARTQRTMTAERMGWFADALETTWADRTHRVVSETNIHTDADVARDAGLPGIIADGMISTNWIQALLLDLFGTKVLGSGSLRTRYVRPILSDDVVTAIVRVAAVEPELVRLEVWCENQRGERCTVGEAVVTR